MSYIPFILINLILFQEPPTPPKVTGENKSTQPPLVELSQDKGKTNTDKAAPGAPQSATKTVDPNSTKTGDAKKTVEPPKEPEKEPDTEFDTFLKQAAEQIAKIDYVSANFEITLRVASETVVAKGTCKYGPDNKSRFELKIDFGMAAGERLYVCDGKIAFVQSSILDRMEIASLNIQQVLPMLDRTKLKPDEKRMVLHNFPFILRTELLRGLPDAFKFTSKSEANLDNRAVIVLEGEWRKAVLENRFQVKDPEQIKQLRLKLPQAIRVTLDKATGWPLLIEQFQRSESAEYKPILIIKFLEPIRFGVKIPDEDFVYVPPKDKKPVDITKEWVQRLQNALDAPTVGTAAAPTTNAPTSPIGKESNKVETKAEEKK